MRRTVRLAVLVAALGLAAPALAAYYVCHPDPAGTRTLALHGDVLGYTLHGTSLTVAVRHDGACRTYGWNAGGGTRSPSQLSCAAVVAAPRQAAPTTVRVVRPLQGADRSDRLAVVSSSGVTLRSWPLPIRVRRHTLQVSGALASYW